MIQLYNGILTEVVFLNKSYWDSTLMKLQTVAVWYCSEVQILP